MFDFDPGLQIWTLLTFGGLLILLAKFAFKPLRKILADREELIIATLKKAEEAQSQVDKSLAENQRALAESRELMRHDLEKARETADQVVKKAQEQARADAKAMLDRARTEIADEVARGMDELKATVTDVSIKVAKQVIKENLDRSRHEALVDEFVGEIKKQHGQHSPAN